MWCNHKCFSFGRFIFNKNSLEDGLKESVPSVKKWGCGLQRDSASLEDNLRGDRLKTATNDKIIVKL